MVGDSESSASSLLCSAQYELARLTACQSTRPKGQDLAMTALSPRLSPLSLSFHHLCATIN